MKKKDYKSPNITFDTMFLEEGILATSNVSGDNIYLRDVMQRSDYEELDGEEQEFFIN